MPMKPKKPCRHPGCPKLTDGLYCEEHEALHRGDRASSSKRGYNRQWQKARARYLKAHPLCIQCLKEGHGLNLQEGGCTIIWFGLTWSLELYQQLNARLWRQGQKHTVVIHHIITKDTHDEDVMKALEKKDMRQSSLIEAVRARIGG